MSLPLQLATSMHGGPTPSSTSRPPAPIESLLEDPNLNAVPIAHAESEPAGPAHLTSSATSLATPATTSMSKARRASLKTRGRTGALTEHDVAIIHLHRKVANMRYDADHVVGLGNVSMLEKVEWARTNIRTLRSGARIARSTRPVNVPSSLARAASAQPTGRC